MSERSGDWGAWLSQDVGLVLAAGSKAKTIAKLIKHTDRVMLRHFINHQFDYCCLIKFFLSIPIFNSFISPEPRYRVSITKS